MQDVSRAIIDTLETRLDDVRKHWIRLTAMAVGFVLLATEQYDLAFSARAQGWISVLGFLVIIVSGWFLLKHHHLAVLMISLAIIPGGAIFLVPILSQLGIVIVVTLSVRWLVLKIRGVAD